MPIESPSNASATLPPDETVKSGDLPPLGVKEMPAPMPLLKMVGPGVILAGLALGSGEFVIWPFITYKSGFVFFWAAMVGVVTQYFLNLEIARYTLATGETAVMGFLRLWKHLAIPLLFLNVIPWMIPAWATGSAEILSWFFWEGSPPYLVPLSIAGLVLCGVALTAGPVLYETLEKTQLVLVSFILIAVVVIAAMIVRGDAIAAQASTFVRPGIPTVGQEKGMLSVAMLLGALAFAGAGGTMNLGQSNYIRDKGYGMGQYIGRITSPLTGQPQPIADIGNQFLHTPENLARWRTWWRNTWVEQLFSFLATCTVCLVLLTLVAYSIFYDTSGAPRIDLPQGVSGMEFVHVEAGVIGQQVGGWAKAAFLLAGIALLLTTEIGVLDCSTRISTDLVKIRWLRDHPQWTEARLYYLFLWVNIAVGVVLLIVGTKSLESMRLFQLTAALNGVVMFLYSGLLIILNCRLLPRALRPPAWRVATLVWSVLFYGTFAFWAAWDQLQK